MRNRKYSLFTRMMRGAHKTHYGPYPPLSSNNPKVGGLDKLVSASHVVLSFESERKSGCWKRYNLLMPKKVFGMQKAVDKEIYRLVGNRKRVARVKLRAYLPLPTVDQGFKTSVGPAKP